MKKCQSSGELCPRFLRGFDPPRCAFRSLFRNCSPALREIFIFPCYPNAVQTRSGGRFPNRISALREGHELKPLHLVKTVFVRACVVYTVLITGVYLIGAFVNAAWLPSPATVGALLLLSLWIGGSLSFLFSDFLVPALRVILHFIATGVVFYLTFGVMGGYLRNGGSAVVLFILYAVLYALAGGVTGLIRILTAESDRKKKPYDGVLKKEREEYQSQFPVSDDAKKGGR